MASNASTPLKEATRYTIVKAGQDFSMALKMESEKEAPLFLRVDETTNIRSTGSSAELHDFKKFTVGDSLLVGFITKLPEGTHAPFTVETLRWTFKCPKPAATASMALVCGLVPRCKNLAFVAESLESGADGKDAYVRIYDPMTLTSTLLPAGHKLRVFPGDPVRLSYAVLPPGALQPSTGDYTIPHDAPYAKDGLLPQWDTSYKLFNAEKLTPEEMQRYESIYDPTQNRSEEKKAKAVEEVLLAGAAVMQCLVNAEQELGNTKIKPRLDSQDGEEVILCADYYPYGTSKKHKKIDMARAARIFRSGQQLQVAPESGPREPRSPFVLAQIRTSKVHDDRIAFSIAVPEHVAERTWTDQWQTIIQRPFLFKPSANQIIQRHFHRKLRDGALRNLLLSGENKPVQQIIKALFGDISSLAKATIDVQHPHQTPAGTFLSMEQTRGLKFAVRELLSTIQAAAGSGKTTTTSAIVMEQTKLHSSCTAMLAPMNVAIDNSSTQLAKQLKKDKRRAIVFQAATFLASRSAEDQYHKFRLPYLLVKLGEGKYGPLTDEEAALVKSANLIASRRYRGLRGMDWSSVLHGEVKMEDRSDFVAAVKILLEKYNPEIVLGTTSILLSFADYLAPFITDVVIDEAGTAAVLDVACLMTSWTKTRTLTMVGDINQLPNFTAPLPDDKRKFGFESALRVAAQHPNVASTQLTEVYRSHPLIVRVLSAFAYARNTTRDQDAALKTKIKAKERDLMMRSGLPCAHSPILVVNCCGKHKSTAAMSYTNEEQARLAYAISQKLEARLPEARVRCLALYSGARDQLNEGFAERGIDLSAGTVDGAQGQECDITVLETAYQPDEQHKSKFMDKRERLTVAISRARDGLVIIGDREALGQLEEWKVLFAIIARYCPGAFVEAKDILEAEDTIRDTDTPSTELALSLQSLGLPSQPSPRPSTSGNDQQPGHSEPRVKSQSDILKDIIASRGHLYDMSDFEEMYAEVKRSRGEALLDYLSPEASPAKRRPIPGQQNLEAIATLVPGVTLPHVGSSATVETIEEQPEEQMDYQDSNIGAAQRDPICEPGAIRRLIEEESDEERDQPTRHVVIDEELDPVEQAECDEIARIVRERTGSDTEVESSALYAAARDQLINVYKSKEPGKVLSAEDVAAEAVARAEQAPSPPSSASTAEPDSPITREGRADTARQASFLTSSTSNQGAVWHAKDAPLKLPRIPKKETADSQQEPAAYEGSQPSPMKEDDEPEQLIARKDRHPGAGRLNRRFLKLFAQERKKRDHDPLGPLCIPKEEQVEHEQVQPAFASNEAPPMEAVLETRNSRPKKPSNKPPLKSGSASKKNQPQSQKQLTKPDSSKPTCLEDLFGEDDQQQPPPEDNGPSKKPELAQPKAKAMPKRQNKPKKTWQFPASSKAIKQLLRSGPTPKFTTHLERKAWHSAGWKAAMEADNLKALKKASGHDVSASESDDDTDSEEETTSGANIQPKTRQSEKARQNVKAKETAKKQATASAKNIAVKQRDDCEKPQESMVDLNEQQMRAQEAPRRSQRSVSREPPTEPKKTLLGPVNPEKPPNLEPAKSKPSASTFRKPRASQF
ncbi:Protein K08D10.5 [Aphelenchoides avenae]|nr:Protein K08D10.5 [Aphelenchus avenae]